MKYNYVCMYKYEVYFFLCTDNCIYVKMKLQPLPKPSLLLLCRQILQICLNIV